MNYIEIKDFLADYIVNVAEVPVSEIDHADMIYLRVKNEDGSFTGSTLASYYNKCSNTPDVLCNLGFFGMANFGICFAFGESGNMYTSSDPYKSALGAGTKVGDPTKFVMGTPNDGGWNDFVTGYPVLLNGKGVPSSFDCGNELNNSKRRTLLGWNNKNIYVVTVYNNKNTTTYFTLKKCAELMHSIGCTHAINLDGGGSSKMYVSGKVVNNPSENRRIVSALGIWLKPEFTILRRDSMNTTDKYIYHTVTNGDSYWAIAAKYLGDGNRYKEIQVLNNKNVLYVGDKIKIANPNYVEPAPAPAPSALQATTLEGKLALLNEKLDLLLKKLD